MKPSSGPAKVRNPREIGWREHIALPELGIQSMRAKIDTGARTSALNTSDLEHFERGGQDWVRFSLPAHGREFREHYEARVADIRDIKNTGGVAETRPIIETTIIVGKRSWVIEISLADRDNMQFDMIVGRTALRAQRLVMNSRRSFLAGQPIERTVMASSDT